MSAPEIRLQTSQPDDKPTIFSPISPVSPQASSKSIYTRSDTLTLSDKYSPIEKGSPQSIHSKPWPVRPQPLSKDITGQRWWDTTVDFVTCLIPLPFFMLAAAVVAVNGKEVNNRDLDFLQQAIKGATTLFPICFAAIAGRAAIKYATWKLEQGTTLGALEQLMGSRTVASAITTQVQLRSFNAVGLGLILVWALSPLGGQSILHILFTPTKVTSTPSNITYFNTRQQSYSAPTGSFANQWFSGFSILFSSSILAPQAVLQSSMDIWGNVKIPYFSSISSDGEPRDSDGWVQTSANNGTLVYSSIFGIPMTGIGFGNTTLMMESTYMQLTCDNTTTFPIPNATDGTPDFKGFLISQTGPFFSYQNVSDSVPFAIGWQGQDVAQLGTNDPSGFVYPQFCPDCLAPSLTNASFTNGTLVFQEFDGVDNVTSVYCTPSQQYMENQIFCTKDGVTQQCQVTAQRLSVLPHFPSEVTYLSFNEVAMGLTALFANSTPQGKAVNQLQNWILDPTSTVSLISNVNSGSNNDGQTPLAFVSLQDIGDRLGQLINAFIHGSMWNSTSYIIETPLYDIQEMVAGGRNGSFVPATTSDIIAMIQNRTSAFTVTANQVNAAQVYLAFFPWLIIFLLSNLVMLLAAITGVYFSRKTIVPDYLGFVSSLAKESPFIRMPDAGINMDGMDKAKLVKDMKVRLGDISDFDGGSNGRVGKLAFARMEETTKVQRGKLYI
ncbi:uncharacterized protein LY89DRAFT_727406 [Mollisia scopiformis]|uniref:Uncharacterized protein n=1 Tax=Mollisia scopiformis TaxID=149040 RepID=A0A194XW66_MOLSC|nr:uncharacterized protein LY89DRAFT_727406 [Mollisia scopiformis]KUJ24376.1 hypothetical protein LY89DRAFT_727406 [Mollisia scopiformis]